MPADGPISNNASAVAEARLFMQNFKNKRPFEFMEDRDTPATFIKLLGETTPEDTKGLKFKLKEQHGRGLPGFLDTGVLKSRVVT